ncbi:hypothetical protein BD289DRAFT_247069 [Coniella lustricola]|uniref:Uncharacterized protein n=1 Tax=Coniella lustricola TaxID=2025994 RepID=A0A2T3A904_9PEZI|nr:hypothetical protein BD289DRAFT_247069 [Coniella lustricola]
MGLFDDAASVISRKSTHNDHSSHSHHNQHHRASSSKDKDRLKRSSMYSVSSHKSRRSSRSRSRSRSPGIAASIFGVGGGGTSDHDKHRHSRHSGNRSGFFGLPNISTRSFFGGDKHRASTSSYRRSPRQGFFHRAYKQLKRLLRDLVYYAKRNPVKVFTLIILPLITGGALTALLARFGLRLPPGLERMLGMGARAMSGGGVGLVGEAVRMASGMSGGGGGGHEGTTIHIERDSWQRDISSGGFGAAFGSGGGRGSNGSWMKSVRDFFD